MTKHDLKELAAMGAELGAAKAEVEQLLVLLRDVNDVFYGQHPAPGLVIDRVRNTLAQQAEPKCSTCNDVGIIGHSDVCPDCADTWKQQAEPTDAFTAVDMATAAAQGFRDGQAAVEQAPAQDELTVYRAVNQFGSDCHFGVESLARVWAGPKGTVERVTLKPAPDLSVVAIRPAQTEQSRWISVEDRLPPVRQILSDSCVLEGKEIPTLYRSTDVICWDGKRVGCQIVEWFHAKMPIGGVTHWMPLPAAPAQGGQ